MNYCISVKNLSQKCCTMSHKLQWNTAPQEIDSFVVSQWHSCHFFYFDHNCADLCETDILWKLDFQMFPSLSPFIGKLKSWVHENLKITVYSHVVGCTLMRWVNTVQRSLCFSSPQYGKHPVLLIVCSHYDWNLKHMTSSCWLASW